MSFTNLMPLLYSGVTRSDSFSIAVLSSSTTSSATKKLAGTPSTSAAIASVAAGRDDRGIVEAVRAIW
jgi:hypothetical protein